jgi:hypothetical protein
MFPIESVERVPGNGQHRSDEQQIPAAQGTYPQMVSSDQVAAPHPATQSKSKRWVLFSVAIVKGVQNGLPNGQGQIHPR